MTTSSFPFLGCRNLMSSTFLFFFQTPYIICWQILLIQNILYQNISRNLVTSTSNKRHHQLLLWSFQVSQLISLFPPCSFLWSIVHKQPGYFQEVKTNHFCFQNSPMTSHVTKSKAKLLLMAYKALLNLVPATWILTPLIALTGPH